MLVSMNRTVVELVAVGAVARAEPLDLLLDLLLLDLEPGELRLPPRQRAQVLADQGADRGPTLGSSDPGAAVDVVWDCDRDVLHGRRLSQFHSFCEAVADAVRASATIPFFFRPARLAGPGSRSVWYCTDGGGLIALSPGTGR